MVRQIEVVEVTKLNIDFDGGSIGDIDKEDPCFVKIVREPQSPLNRNRVRLLPNPTLENAFFVRLKIGTRQSR